MKLKNEIFASALDWLVAHQKVDGQKSLAVATGISQNTISRIMTGKVEPSDDTLRRLSEVYGFNMAWLRGNDPNNMFIESNEVEKTLSSSEKAIQKIVSPIYEKLIGSLENQIADKDHQIERLEKEVEVKDNTIEKLQDRILDLERLLSKNTPISDYPFPIGVADERKLDPNRV